LARQIYDTLGTPFAVELLRESRLRTRVELAKLTDANPANAQTREALQAYGEHPEWNGPFLEQRAVIYRQTNEADLSRALDDVMAFREKEPNTFEKALGVAAPATAAPAPAKTAAN
jgi:hypothetical protein